MTTGKKITIVLLFILSVVGLVLGIFIGEFDLLDDSSLKITSDQEEIIQISLITAGSIGLFLSILFSFLGRNKKEQITKSDLKQINIDENKEVVENISTHIEENKTNKIEEYKKPEPVHITINNNNNVNIDKDGINKSEIKKESEEDEFKTILANS